MEKTKIAPDYAGHSGAHWTYEREETSDGYAHSVYDEQGQRLTEPYIDERAARLMVAAPEMLSTLKVVLACPQAAVALVRVGTGKRIGNDFHGAELWESNAFDDIKAAIAKAEGRTNA